MQKKRKETFEKLARLGFAARGVTYGLIGVLAIMVALGEGGQTTGTRGALETLTGSGWGIALLVLVALGLFGYGIYRLTSGILDMDNEGKDGKALAKRVAYGASGVVHIGLAGYCVALVTGNGAGGGGGQGAESMTATLMSAPFGIFLVGLAGVIGFIVAGFQTKKATKEEYKEHMAVPSGKGWIDRAIKVGIISRAAVFAVISGLLIVAAVTANPDNARGIGGALRWVQSQSYGGVLLFAIAAGLVCFAFYSFLQARYRVIEDPEAHA